MRMESPLHRRSCRVTLIVFALACLGVWSLAFPAARAEARPAGTIKMSCWQYDRGNTRVVENRGQYGDYRDKYPGLMLDAADKLPYVVEYDVDFPVDADWTLRVRYASAGERPLEVWIDDKRVGTACRKETNNAPPYMDRHPNVHEGLPVRTWHMHGAEWEESCTFAVTKGKHTLKFTRNGPPANLIEIYLESPVAFPKGTKGRQHSLDINRIPVKWRRVFLPPDSVNVEALRLAIADSIKTFGPKYPKGPQYLKQLADLTRQQIAAAEGADEQSQKIADSLKSLQSQAMLAHPALKFDKLLFVKKFTRGASVYTGHRIHGNGGGNLCVLSPVSTEGKVTELVPELAGGVFGRFDLSFDATKVVFCYCREDGNYRIYEIDIDPATGKRAAGKSLRQITFKGDDEAEVFRRYQGHYCGNGYDDIDPIYLPNGKIMFASTRSRRAVLCAPQTSTTLYVMDADGKNMRCISGGQVNELAPCLLDDGRVVYTRWEYIDKGFGNVQSLWAVRPDGSGSDHVYKNMVVRPGAMINACSIPNSRKMVTIGIGHHGGHSGPVILLDTRRHRRTADAMTNITPEISYPGLYPMKGRGGVFREPYPFSEKFFLVSHRPGAKQKAGAGHQLYVLDAWGNRAELYRDPNISCFQPTPLRPRRRPTAITPVDDTSAVNVQYTKSQGLATMFLLDVYQGLEGIKRGRVKYVRVMCAMNLSWLDAWRAGKQGDGAGMQASAVSGDGDVSIKKIYGLVKVHDDGSAFFTVPANRNVYFQALDENYMELHRMRTFINLRPGETRSCIGCHEFRRFAPYLRNARPKAMAQPIAALLPQPGDTGPRTIHYARDVQPILDKHCLSCHSGEKPKGDLDLAGVLNEKFSRSYDTLKKKKLVSYLEGGFGSANVPAEPPMTFGSHQSKLVERIRKAPCKAKLTREEFIRIVTWVDANAPYYGTHRGKKNLRWKDEPDFRPLPLAGK